MKQKAKVALLVALLMITGATVAAAAANPIPSATAPSPGSASAAAPTDYLQAIKLLQDNKYGENEIKSFVYSGLFLFDRHAEVNNLLLLFANEDLYMKVRRAGSIPTRISKMVCRHRRQISPTFTVLTGRRADSRQRRLRVNACSLASFGPGGKTYFPRTRQEWKIIDGGGYWPRIVSYIAEPAP
jgi:hypothetical protein